MKYKSSLAFVIFLLASIAGVQVANAQQSLDPKEVVVRNLIDNQQYVFYARYATPMSGRQRYLTPEYSLSISKDTINSDLPYFGRAYSAPVNPTDGGIKFTSTDFDYQLTPRKKGGWEVAIKPKDNASAQQLNLTVFENGTATLQVNSSNHQPISFNGYISEKKLRHKRAGN